MKDKKMGMVSVHAVIGFFLPYLLQIATSVQKGMTWKQAIAGAVVGLFAAYTSLADPNKAN